MSLVHWAVDHVAYGSISVLIDCGFDLNLRANGVDRIDDASAGMPPPFYCWGFDASLLHRD